MNNQRACASCFKQLIHINWSIWLQIDSLEIVQVKQNFVILMKRTSLFELLWIKGKLELGNRGRYENAQIIT